jgi:Ubiquitin carboxyl-terminal hydrolase, family 1
MGPKRRARRIQESIELSLSYNSVGMKYARREPDDDDFPYHYVTLVSSSRSGHPYWLDGARRGPIRINDSDEDPVEAMLSHVQTFVDHHQELEGHIHVLALAELPRQTSQSQDAQPVTAATRHLIGMPSPDTVPATLVTRQSNGTPTQDTEPVTSVAKESN